MHGLRVARRRSLAGVKCPGPSKGDGSLRSRSERAARCGTGPFRAVVALGLAAILADPSRAIASSFVNFESGAVRPLALSADGERLCAVNTPDGRLETFSVSDGGLVPESSVKVGLEPVAVAVHGNLAWVVNHLSDSVSIVDLRTTPPRVVATLLVGDEPRDVVFAGPGRSRAFVTTAHRGQGSPVDPQLTTPGVGRADVWVFDVASSGEPASDAPSSILSLFGDTPRALATSADGSEVWAAVFLSGNRTATVAQEAVCDGGASVGPCTVEGLSMPGGLPAPNANVEGIPQPESGLIVGFDPATGAWRDELGRDWRAAMGFSLPDLDVFRIDATTDPPRQVEAWSDVGTVIYGLAVNPATGAVYAANTEANNRTRFAGEGLVAGHSVRGHLHESRVTVLRPGGSTPVRLNPHVDYDVVPSPPGVAERSLALPVAIATDATGAHVFVAAMGSDVLAVLDAAELEAGAIVPDTADHVSLSGGGPTGLVVDHARGRVYVATRFDDGISVVDVAARSEIQHLRMFDPEPAEVREGRRYLYDARFSSSNGENACASCHVFGHLDALAWDLGDPDLSVVGNPNPIAPLPSAGGWIPDRRFHPMKGPMTTQTLRGIAHGGPMHWRGDRTTGVLAPGDSSDERAAFLQFAEAFDGLLGRATPVGPEEMDEFASFALSLVPPPNPVRRLDDTLTPSQQVAFEEFTQRQPCGVCHVVNESAGFFGSDGHSALNPNPGPREFMKVPSLRGLYEKVGLFWVPPGVPFGDREPIGDQVRGYGILNDGSSGRLPPVTEDYLLVFPTDLKPIVGQQVTLRSATDPAVTARLDLLRSRAEAGDCDLVASTRVDGEARGFLRASAETLRSDRAGEAWSWAEMLRVAEGAEPVTVSCIPPGTGERVALDHDSDGILDRDEADRGSDPADGSSVPAPAESLARARAHVSLHGRTGADAISFAGRMDAPAGAGSELLDDVRTRGVAVAIRSADGLLLARRSFPAGACRRDPAAPAVTCGDSPRSSGLRIRSIGPAGHRVRGTVRGIDLAGRPDPPLGIEIVAGSRAWSGSAN